MRTWEIKVEENNGKFSFNRSNTGFNAFELIGILDFMKDQIIRQIHDEEKTTVKTEATRVFNHENDTPHFEEVTSSDDFRQGIRSYRPISPTKSSDLTFYERQIINGKLIGVNFVDPDRFIIAK